MADENKTNDDRELPWVGETSIERSAKDIPFDWTKVPSENESLEIPVEQPQKDEDRTNDQTKDKESG